ncbi:MULTISPECIES: FxsA family protein [Pacificibacter]|uniref:FxsA family protein n=1 Tax=Pacificibacter TaxID=1042323 RepID=UPI001C080B9B|nr:MULTISPECIES: FxsA family protein [Pacificibacter]MBU2936157.1 FxsA family protein [Pacificibacter marinus]MDO6614993.1 FxsA family protein [Pacificibacter sp. 1_MG-2023]
MWLFALFVAVPVIEIALFIQVGGFIGLFPTLAIVVLTAFLGTYLVKQQGAIALSQLRSSFGELRDPSEPLAHGAMILFSGAMLLTPGFFTDAVGFLLLIPAFRTRLFVELQKRIKVQSFTMGGGMGGGNAGFGDTQPGNTQDPNTIDGEWEPVSPKDIENNGPSGWTRH